MKKYLFPLLDPVGLLKVGCASFVALLIFLGSTLVITMALLIAVATDYQGDGIAWMLLLPSAGLYLFGIVAMLYVCGYLLKVARAGATEPSPKLPSLQPAGTLIWDGLKTCVLSVPASLPPVLLFLACGVAIFAGIEGAMGVGQQYLGEEARKFLNIFVLGGGGFLFLGLELVYILFTNLLFPVLGVHYAVTRDWKSLFCWRWALVKIWQNLGAYLAHLAPTIILYFLWFGVYLVVYFLTFGIGTILLMPLLPVLALHAAHMLGRFYGENLMES